MAARNGIRFGYDLTMIGRVIPMPGPRPSAMLGPYVAAFLSLPLIETSHAAVSGVLAGTTLLQEDQGVRDESYALLEELGLLLTIDVEDILNRSADRQQTLDDYRASLVDVATRSQEHLGQLEQRQDDADAVVREVRKQASEIQRALNNALREKDYATASSRQAELSAVQGEVAVATAEQREVQSVVNLFEDSLAVAAERVTAIDANREALLAGVHVVDIPGADDLGVLQEGERGRGPDAEDVFGPTE